MMVDMYRRIRLQSTLQAIVNKRSSTHDPVLIPAAPLHLSRPSPVPFPERRRNPMTREASCIVRPIRFILVLTTILINSAFAATTDASAPAISTDEQSALAAYGNLPLTFVENRGQ